MAGAERSSAKGQKSRFRPSCKFPLRIPRDLFTPWDRTTIHPSAFVLVPPARTNCLRSKISPTSGSRLLRAALLCVCVSLHGTYSFCVSLRAVPSRCKFFRRGQNWRIPDTLLLKNRKSERLWLTVAASSPKDSYLDKRVRTAVWTNRPDSTVQYRYEKVLSAGDTPYNPRDCPLPVFDISTPTAV